jgi:hypothetical protein
LFLTIVILYVHEAEAFEQRLLYDVPIHMSRHPLLSEYIHSMLAGCRTWLLRGELEKLCVVLLSTDGRTLETLVIEPSWSAAILEATAGADEDHPLPLLQLEEAFRAGMVALVAAPVNNVIDQKDSEKPNSFRILAQTVEDATSRGAAVNDLNAANSWVLADPFWCEDQQKAKEISPIKAIQRESLPVRLNVYMEKQQPAPVTQVADKM